MSSILTVSQINKYISFKIKNDPKLKGIAIKGEITGFVRNSKSGHCYFSLKDEASLIKAVMFSSNAERLKFVPENGMSVIAFGNIDAYERDGVYQLVAFDLVPSGIGEEAIRLEQLKQELTELGVFAKEKKQICRYPDNIAVVSSADGAALWDIVSVVKRRYPLTKITVFPTLVQGEAAPKNIASALYQADISGADTIILARGGGSKQDLAAFNTREVAVAIYSCETPLISAVGHEVDYSIADMIADLRAPTPTGAAELATPDISEVKRDIYELTDQLRTLAVTKTNVCEMMLDAGESLLESLSPVYKVQRLYESIDGMERSLEDLLRSKLKVCDLVLNAQTQILKSFDPQNVLKRGYGILYSNCAVVTDVDKLHNGDLIDIVLRNGRLYAEVKKIEKDDLNEL